MEQQWKNQRLRFTQKEKSERDQRCIQELHASSGTPTGNGTRHARSQYAALSDDELLARVDALAASERHATVELIASLAELDARRLYLGAGCSSLFTYCTQVLHLSEHAAYGRIEAARAVRRHPRILPRIAEGSLTLTSVCLLAPVLNEENSLEPSAVKREVWKRDGGRCAFVGTEGRCRERGFLEIHHVVPFADGGESSVDNLQLRCAHTTRTRRSCGSARAGRGSSRRRPGPTGQRRVPTESPPTGRTAPGPVARR